VTIVASVVSLYPHQHDYRMIQKELTASINAEYLRCAAPGGFYSYSAALCPDVTRQGC
jgi:hypothetical protein